MTQIVLSFLSYAIKKQKMLEAWQTVEYVTLFATTLKTILQEWFVKTSHYSQLYLNEVQCHGFTLSLSHTGLWRCEKMWQNSIAWEHHSIWCSIWSCIQRFFCSSLDISWYFSYCWPEFWDERHAELKSPDLDIFFFQTLKSFEIGNKKPWML